MNHKKSINSFLQAIPFRDSKKSVNPPCMMDIDEEEFSQYPENENPYLLENNSHELDEDFVKKWYPYYSKLLRRLPPFCNKSAKYTELVNNVISDAQDEFHQYRVVYLGLLTKMVHDKKEIKQYIIPGCWEDEVNLKEAMQECITS